LGKEIDDLIISITFIAPKHKNISTSKIEFGMYSRLGLGLHTFFVFQRVQLIYSSL
jgi:hypothetical protein